MKKTLTIQKNKTVFKGFFQVNHIEFNHALYQGGTSKCLTREVFTRGEAVVVLLYDIDAQQVVLVEQCRAGALKAAQTSQQLQQAWLLEPVAGGIDADETALQAAKRETYEETGLNIEKPEFICKFYPSPGACDEILHLYACPVDVRQVLVHAGKTDENEDIKVVRLSFAKAKQSLVAGEYNVASTYIALQWLFFIKLKQ